MRPCPSNERQIDLQNWHMGKDPFRKEIAGMQKRGGGIAKVLVVKSFLIAFESRKLSLLVTSEQKISTALY